MWCALKGRALSINRIAAALACATLHMQQPQADAVIYGHFVVCLAVVSPPCHLVRTAIPLIVFPFPPTLGAHGGEPSAKPSFAQSCCVTHEENHCHGPK